MASNDEKTALLKGQPAEANPEDKSVIANQKPRVSDKTQALT